MGREPQFDSEPLRVAVGGDGGERLVVALLAAVGAKEQRARIDAQRELAQIRVVDLQRRAVLARLGVVRAAQERPSALAEEALERGVDRGMARVRVRVDETALPFRNEDVAVGAE